jgi:hypothetical protein
MGNGAAISPFEWLGRNNGPDILESLLSEQWRGTLLQDGGFAPPDTETGMHRTRKTEELGLSYAEYLLDLLERGGHPPHEDAARIRAGRSSA